MQLLFTEKSISNSHTILLHSIIVNGTSYLLVWFFPKRKAQIIYSMLLVSSFFLLIFGFGKKASGFNNYGEKLNSQKMGPLLIISNYYI